MRVSYSAVLSMDMPADAKLWSPDSPFLYTADITVLTGGRISSDGKYLGGGTVIDTVHTYFGHRTISTGMVDGVPRVLLNEKPYYLIGPLDQGWFPDGLYTAANDAALRSDLVAMKKMGMNSVSEKRSIVSAFILKIIILPRQAREKHRESTQKERDRFDFSGAEAHEGGHAALVPPRQHAWAARVAGHSGLVRR